MLSASALSVVSEFLTAQQTREKVAVTEFLKRVIGYYKDETGYAARVRLRLEIYRNISKKGDIPQSPDAAMLEAIYADTSTEISHTDPKLQQWQSDYQAARIQIENDAIVKAFDDRFRKALRPLRKISELKVRGDPGFKGIANINALDIDGNTLLHAAAATEPRPVATRINREEIASDQLLAGVRLLELGAACKPNNYGRSVTDVAALDDFMPRCEAAKTKIMMSKIIGETVATAELANPTSNTVPAPSATRYKGGQGL
jgi:hypothetical protein